MSSARAAGMRHGPHRPARRADCRLGSLDQRGDLGMLEVAHLPDGGGQVERPDEHEVDALDGEDRVDVGRRRSPTRSGRR